MPTIKSGPITAAEIQAIWESVVDKSYRDPLLEAGEGGGFEAWTQLFEQLARASNAVDVTTQAMFISPWSGQSNPPAGGGARATVTLSFSRSGLVSKLLVLRAGTTIVSEVAQDEGENGPEEVITGRRYVLLEDLVLHPGDRGPVEAEAAAEFDGYGYNNPLPGTIRRIDQPGAGFDNELATVTVASQPAVSNGTASRARLRARNVPDMFVPDQVGQYVLFEAGANAGRIGRLSAFDAPVPPAFGSSVDLELLFSLQLSGVVGTFQEGEIVALASPAAFGIVVGDFDPAIGKLVVALRNGGTPAVGTTLAGGTSGATGTVMAVLHSSAFAAEAPSGGIGGASWRILDWVADWGLSVSNVESPSGGRAAMLDELGGERNIDRSPGEDDESYRARIREVGDVVSPNAIRRSLNRALGNVPWCFREVGSSYLPGWFFDGDGSPAGGDGNTSTAVANQLASYDEDVFLLTGAAGVGSFAFDERVVLETTTFDAFAEGYFGRIDGGVTFVFVRKSGRLPASFVGTRVRGLHSGATFNTTAGAIPAQSTARRFRRYFDLAQFRAFFLVGVPRLPLGESGFAFDVGPHSAFDAPPFVAAFDGQPWGNAPTYLRVYNALNDVRAGGVGFELYLEDIACP